MQGELAVASPTVEDMIIAYSTIPGYVSQRDHETGTWFIQALVETFMDKACDHELIDLLRLTSEYLSKFTNDRGEKQTCNIEMRHLYKKIYLKPGTRNDRRISDATLSPLMKRSHSTPPSSPKNHRKQWILTNFKPIKVTIIFSSKWSCQQSKRAKLLHFPDFFSFSRKILTVILLKKILKAIYFIIKVLYP